MPDESRVASGAASPVGPAAAAAVFATPLQGYLGGGDGGGSALEEELRGSGLESSAGRASTALAMARSSESETLASDVGRRDARDAAGEADLGVEPAVAGEQREPAGAPVLSPPMAHARGEYTSEEMELAAAIAEASLEHGMDTEERSRGVFQEGGGGGKRHPVDDAGAGEEKERVASLLGVAKFDLLDGLDDGDAVDEWEDDLDPGYMVMAVSEEEFHGQVGGCGCVRAGAVF